MPWKLKIGEKEYVMPDAATLRSWLTEGRARPDTPAFDPEQQKWLCLRDIAELSDVFKPSETLIHKHREDYTRALFAIDHTVGELVREGKELKAIVVLTDTVGQIVNIHESLEVYYGLILRGIEVLQRFGSERLRQLGHEPVWTRTFLKDADVEQEMLEQFVLDNLRKRGYSRTHWYLKNVLLCEIEYMLDALEILVEPEFVPLETQTAGVDEAPDRYIPPSVKIAVWRRDEGKCVQCKTREKLEYDHIIPVSKGGSNTERNVQLLCEKCNREKAARIQ